ncbi:hypothetical protein BJV82DRAFT_341433 [Fennellomyces sp. T-0311]|nr:hypothetical protein BJV82DRAFT_341433 [Fennellomyces sp. T-0311]
MLKLFAPKKKRKSTVDMMPMSQPDKDILPLPVQPSPELLMPKPRYAVPPTKDVLQDHEYDKTELEPPEPDVSPIMLPHRVRFSSSSPSHGTPANIKVAPASPSGVAQHASIAASSDDSHRVYETAVQSPAPSPPQVTQQHLRTSSTSLGDVEALQRQVLYIQQLCEKERQEWMKREHAHRLREKEMLEKISETQDQLRQALAQVQQQHQQQQQQLHHHHHPSRDDSGYMEYDEDNDHNELDNMSYHHMRLPRTRSFERPGSRNSKKWACRRSYSVEKPVVAMDDYRIPRRSRSRASLGYYDDDEGADVYFADPDSPVEDGEEYDWDYYEHARPPPRPRISESTPTVQYVRPRRSYRRRAAHYHPAYHYYYPYDAL